ncbi:MAG: hypothetical protein P4L90_03120 [Rhodopila sp.]|nr:hypothetical protein [Rhodopila sp.]
MSSFLSARRGFLRLTAFLAPATVAAAPQGRDNLVLHVPHVGDLTQIDASRLAQVDHGVCDVAGYWAPGDGGGGLFDWDPAASEPADEFMLFRPQSLPPDSPGRWRRRLSHDGSLTFEMAGAKGDGATDDWAATQKVVEKLRKVGGGLIKLRPRGRYLLSGDLDLTSPTTAPIVLEGSSSPLAHARGGSPVTFQASRLILSPTRHLKLGEGCIVRRVVVWRQGLTEKPGSLAEVRQNVNRWFREDGLGAPRSIGIHAPYSSIAIEQVAVIGFHTGVRLEGGDNRVQRCYIDAAGYGIECTNIAGDCELNAVNVSGWWSASVTERDAYGDHAYRPGTAFYVHDRADGMQINNCQANHWVNGLVLSNVWLVSVLAFNAETSNNDGKATYGIWTQNEVRHVSIIDPRLVTSSTCIRFSHANKTSAVDLIGGSLEMDGPSGHCVQIDAGTSGQIFGTMTSNGSGSALVIAAGIIQWKIFGLQLWTNCFLPWATIAPASLPNVYLVGTRALDGANQHYLQSHINERTLIAYDSTVPTLDGSPRAPLTVESLTAGGASATNVSLLRNGVEVGALQTTERGILLSAEQIAFFGGQPTKKPMVAGTRHDNNALGSLISALATLGLISDRTTP